MTYQTRERLALGATILRDCLLWGLGIGFVYVCIVTLNAIAHH